VKFSLCVYEVHIKLAKCELVKQIKGLQAGNRVLEQILGALSEDEEVPEILKRLKHRHAYDSIVEWLDRYRLFCNGSNLGIVFLTV
jgi:hypothetical protein